MEYILKSENNIIVSLPECWKMLPQGRTTPVKLYFEKFVREGATNGNYLYIDAQDLGGMDKAPLRQVSVWVMGRMQEANEVTRLSKQMLGADIDASVIQTLSLGHFMVACGNNVTKVYVWPHRVPEEMSIAVAKGELPPEKVKDYLKQLETPKVAEEETAPVFGSLMTEAEKNVSKMYVGLKGFLELDKLEQQVMGMLTLLRLIELKLLQREEIPHGGWFYFAVEGAKDRIKEIP
jgi:hypothetical protein